MKLKLLIALLFVTGIAQAQTRQTGGISFTPQWNFKISGSDTTWQFGNTIMSPTQFPYFLTKWQSDQRYAPISGGFVPTSRLISTGLGLLGGGNLGSNLTLSADTTKILTKYALRQFVGWGDSMTDGTGKTATDSSYTANLGRITSSFVWNKGVPGETSTEIKTRFLAGGALLQLPTIIWAGRNNYSDSATVISDITAMVNKLKGLNNNNYLIISITNASGEPVGNSGYNIILATNKRLSYLFPGHFVDLRTALLSYGDGSGTDNTDIANGVIPSSLRSDGVHLNDKGYRTAAIVLTKYFNVLNGETLYSGSQKISGTPNAFTGVGIEISTDVNTNEGRIQNIDRSYTGTPVNLPLSLQYNAGSSLKFIPNGGDISSSFLTVGANTNFFPIGQNGTTGAWERVALGDLSSSDINITGGAKTAVGSNVTLAIANNAITNAKLATMANNTVKANVSGGSAVPTDVAITSIAPVQNITSSSVTGSNPITVTPTSGTYDLKIPTILDIGGSDSYIRLGRLNGTTGFLQFKDGSGNLAGAIYASSLDLTTAGNVTVTTGSPGAGGNNAASQAYVDAAVGSTGFLKGSTFLAQTYEVAPTTGQTVAPTRNFKSIIRPAGALAALTIQLPSSPSAGEIVWITITQPITTISYTNGTASTAPTTLAARGEFSLTYSSATGSWH